MLVIVRVKAEGREQADGKAQRGEAQPVADNEFEDAGGSRAEGHADADLRRALPHHGCEHAIKPHAGQQHRDRGEYSR